MEFANLVTSCDDFVLKMTHLRQELQDAELVQFENQCGDIAMVFIKLHNDIEAAVNFLKVIRNSPTGPKRVVKSSFFEDVFLICHQSQNEDLQQIFLDLLTKVKIGLIGQSKVELLINPFTKWVSSSNVLTAEYASKVMNQLCMEYPDIAIPAIVGYIHNVNHESTLTLRYAAIIGKLLNPVSTTANNTTVLSGANTTTIRLPVGSEEDATYHNSLFDACLRHGAIEFMLSLNVKSTDLLVQLVGIELLSQFGGLSAGLEYVISNDVLAWLMSQALSTMDGSDNMLASACLLEIGNLIFTSLAARTSSVLVEHMANNTQQMQDLINCINYVLDNEAGKDEGERTSALSTLTAVCSLSVHSLHLVLCHQTLVETWYSLINKGPDSQAALIHSITTVLLYHKHVRANGANSNIASASSGVLVHGEHDMFKLVDMIGKARSGATTTMPFIIKLASQPIDNLHIAASRLFEALCLQDDGWGVNYCFSSYEFFSYLNNRALEHGKEQMDAKYSVILALSKNIRYRMLNPDHVKVLDLYLEKGAYYAAHQAELAEPATMER